MTILRAAWICPIAAPPIADGWVAIAGDRIRGVGPMTDLASEDRADVRDLGAVALLPALVNAHTHLELSWLRGRVPPAATFVDWIRQLFLTRGGRREAAGNDVVMRAVDEAIAELRACGVAAVGDISNSLVPVAPLRRAGVHAVVFHELLGFDLPHGRLVEDTREARVRAAAEGGDHVRVAVAPHAPYSVSPELFRAIREEVVTSAVPISSVHAAESDAEVEFLEHGTGPWPGMLRWVGSWREGWTPPGVGPIEYLDGLGVLDSQTLVVHGVQLDDASLGRLAEIGCTLVTCPRSNQWVGVGVPPVARFYASGVNVAIGTDSLASADDLNVFAELKAMRWLAPDVPAVRLLESATLIGARALGLDGEIGSIEPGKRAELIAVEVPHDVGDVVEYLVGGIGPRHVRWVTT